MGKRRFERIKQQVRGYEIERVYEVQTIIIGLV